MKNLIIIGAIGMGAFLFMKSRKQAAAKLPPVQQGRRTYTTSGEIFTLREGKNGQILDELGGNWV